MEIKLLGEKIVGTWKLKSIFFRNENDQPINLYGENPNGILMYDNYGYMNAQIGFSNREHMSSDKLTGGTDKEKLKAFDTFMAYYGKYYEKEPGVIIHQVEGCLIPNWVGEDEIRYCKIDKNLLYISTPETLINNFKTKIEVIWERVL